ncbi:MAG TPA: EVE domain-containing protein [Bdellovibrio sp.]
MKYWLMKSEPDVYSIDNLHKDKTTPWEGVRNYQARNFMMNDMQPGDLVLFYHSNAEPPGVAGIAKVSKVGVADKTQFDKKSEYYDEKSSKDKPRWICVEVEFVSKFKNLVSLADLRANDKLSDMVVLQKGSRLSVQPCDKKHFDIVKKMGGL